jgi:hypothetical protein
MESRNKKIKERIILLIKDSTVHGLPKALKANYLISKIVWILFFIGSISYCIYLILTAISSFFQYNTVTNIETKTEIPADFPVITICNLNQFQKNNSLDVLKNYSEASLVKLLSNSKINIVIMNIMSSYIMIRLKDHFHFH